MKRYYSLLMVVALAGFTACGGDDDEKKPSHSFIDQDARGRINNVVFEYDNGYADVDAEEIRVTLTLEQPEDICDMMFPEGNTVFFYVDNEVKLTKLFFNANTWEGETVTLYQEDGSESWIADKGAVEILSVTDTQVTGRLDARYDSETFINGNFTVQRCPM